jgi:uncharacterized membrane protein SirB2
MGTLKTIHVTFAALSFSGFFIRGIWMLRDSLLLKQRWVRIAPQVVDTVLLASAIALAVQWRLSPLDQPWLMAKIIALVVYIGVGLVALRLGRTKTVRAAAWVLGMLIFAYIVSVAVTRSALGWLAFV